jgi:hypothetical protein
MVSMSELLVVVSANTADLVHFPLILFASSTWVVAWEVGIFPAVCHVRRGAATLEGPLRDVGAPHCLSRPSSRRRTPRRGEAVPPARSPCCRPCSCAGLHHAVVPSTSICLTVVGDSPRGPLEQWGKPHLKPATKPKYVKPNHAGT